MHAEVWELSFECIIEEFESPRDLIKVIRNEIWHVVGCHYKVAEESKYFVFEQV